MEPQDNTNSDTLENQGFTLKGSMVSTLIKRGRDPVTGELVELGVEVYRKDNLIVNAGFDFVADAIGKGTGRPGVMSHIAMGTNATASAPGNTSLGAETARKAAAYTHVAGTKVFEFETTFDPGEATAALTEAGILNASSGGILLDRVVFPVINKGANDTLTQRFVFTMS